MSRSTATRRKNTKAKTGRKTTIRKTSATAKTRRKNNKKTDNSQDWLPPKLKAYLILWAIRFSGVVLMVFSLALTAALLTYNMADPSINTAGSVESVQNIMGISGAYISDILVQSLGIASFALPMVLVVWGWQIIEDLYLSCFWLRLPLLLGALFCLSISFVAISSSGDIWSPTTHLGGMVGTLFMGFFGGILAPLGFASQTLILSLVFGFTGSILLLFALGITYESWMRGFSFIKNALRRSIYISGVAILAISQWFRTIFSRDKEARAVRKEERAACKAAKKAARESRRNAPKVRDGAKAKISLVASGDSVSQSRAKKAVKFIAPKKGKAKKGKRAKADLEPEFAFMAEESDYELPPLSLLQEVPKNARAPQHSQSALAANAEMLEGVLLDYGIKGEIVKVRPGPVVTLYELEPAPGIKTSRVISLADDIARSMSALSVRISVVPGKSVIGIEMPNDTREIIWMRELLSSRIYENNKANLPLVLGKDISGSAVIADLAKMPHLLVAGTTGSGKSVAINTMICSLLYRLPPERCRFIMIDPKMLELSVYNGIPHLLAPVVTEPGKAVMALKWVVAEMEQRYRLMSRLNVRNVDGYNQRLSEARKKGEVMTYLAQTGFDEDTGKPVFEEQVIDLTELPYIVVVVDEFADLMMVAGKEVEACIQRIAQMARAAGIHLIMATQRPSVNVITGTIKANFPTRISFSVTSKIDSRTIIGEQGAEQLLGQGDMLYRAAGGRLQRVHGPFVRDHEVEEIVSFLSAQGEANFAADITQGGAVTSDVFGAMAGDASDEGDNAKIDPLFDQAVDIVSRAQKASTSFVQRQLKIGYNRAANIIEEMEKQGMISAANHVGRRKVLVRDPEES